MAVSLAWAATGGVLFFLGYAGFGIWPLALVAWTALWAGLERTRARGAAASALAGFVFGWVAHAGGFAWLWRLVDVFLAGDQALGAALWLAHSIWFAAGYALYGALFAALRARGWPVAAAGIPPLVAIEWLWPEIFPVHLGDAFVDRTRFVQIADLGGALLVTALALLVNAAVFESLRGLAERRRPPRGTWAVAALSLAAAAAYGTWRMAALEDAMARASELRVGIVQANLDVLAKRRDPERMHEAYLQQTHELLADGGVDLVVWPETVYTRGIQGPLPVAGDPIRRDVAVPLLFGAASVRSGPDGRALVFNSAFLVEEDGTIRDGYDKNLLVPFAERVPVAALARWLPHAQEFGAADETPPLTLGPWKFATPICYEAAVARYVRRMVRDADPDALVMLSNDAWFGDSHEPWIHFAVARMRAIEHHRFVVRAANGGISAVIDPLGRIAGRTALLTRENLRGSIRKLDDDTIYGRVGDWPGVVALLATVAMLARGRSGQRT